MYEGQGHKLSTFKMQKKWIFTNWNLFLWSEAEDVKNKHLYGYIQKTSFIDTKT